MLVTQIRGNTDEEGKVRTEREKYGQHYKIQMTVEKVRTLDN